MNATRVLRNTALPRTLAGLVHKETAEQVSNKPRNLYETLARLPDDGVGARVYQSRWQSKGIGGCFYEVERVVLKHEGTRGRAWGWLVWRGKPVTPEPVKICGGLKYMWREGVSKGANLPPVQEVSPLPVEMQLSEMPPIKDPREQQRESRKRKKKAQA